MSENFARGRSAEIFLVGNEKIMKLFFSDYPKAVAKKEYQNTKIVADLGCTGLKVYNIVENDNRFGFVMDYVDGISQNDKASKNPLYLFRAGKDLARCHIRVQSKHTHELEDIRKVCIDLLDDETMTFLTKDEKKAAEKYINDLSDDDTVLHLDFHTGNVLVDSQGNCKIIDWMTAARGNRAVEVAMMEFLFSPEAEMFPEATEVQRKFFLAVKNYVGKQFFREYQKVSPISPVEVDRYRLLALILRRSWGIEFEKDYLTKTIRAMIRACMG